MKCDPRIAIVVRVVWKYLARTCPSGADWAREAQDYSATKTDFQEDPRARRREHVVVALKPACVVERRILPSQDPTSTQNTESPRDSAGHASLQGLRCVHPLWPTPAASEALAGVGAIGGRLPRLRMFEVLGSQ